jgi:nitrogen regulatory protein PII
MSLRTYPKKRLDIFVEAPAVEQVTDALLAAGVQGFTILEASAGQGHGGPWRIDDSFNDASHVVCVVCLLDAAMVDGAVSAVFEIVKRQIGVLTISDVMVVRPEHF